MARLFTCANVLEQLEQLEDSNGDGDEGYRYQLYARRWGHAWHDMHDMDLDARAMDQDGERPGEGSLCDSGK